MTCEIMFLRYFVVDIADQFQVAERSVVEDVWRGKESVAALGFATGDQLRIASVLCDEESLAPKVIFFLRTELEGGRITEGSRFEAYEAMTKHHRRRYDSEAAYHQLAGWPRDWQSQLAVALDVPAVQLRRIGVGGPLLMADLWGFSIDRILDYFEQAADQ